MGTDCAPQLASGSPTPTPRGPRPPPLCRLAVPWCDAVLWRVESPIKLQSHLAVSLAS